MNEKKAKKAMVVQVEDGKSFPESLAGRWAEGPMGGSREFVLKKDGTLESVVIGLGGERIKPGEITKVPLITGEGVFEPGTWYVSYSAKEKQLYVEINIKHFKMQAGANVVEGNLREVFFGKVSEDGTKWETTYTSYPEYYVTTDVIKKKSLKEDQGYFEEEMTFYHYKD
jgi:hypothetical protein